MTPEILCEAAQREAEHAAHTRELIQWMAEEHFPMNREWRIAA